MIEVKELEVSYGAIAAVRGISLNVEPASIVALLGSNGAGKSSTLRAISGLTLAARGHVVVDGHRASGKPAHKIAKLGVRLVPEGGGVFNGMSVEDNLLAGVEGWRTQKQQVESAYERFPALATRRSQLAGSLSGGERQMLALGRALVSKPDYLLLDEPSLGLSPLVVKSLFSIIQELRSEGIGILLVEQNARQALELTDFAYVLEVGAITLSGPGPEIRQNPQVIDRYLGTTRTSQPHVDNVKSR